MAPRFFGRAYITTEVLEGRGYVFVAGSAGNRVFYDIDGSALTEMRAFESFEAALAWAKADAEMRRRAS
jgi:hypothetical protein